MADIRCPRCNYEGVGRTTKKCPKCGLMAYRGMEQIQDGEP